MDLATFPAMTATKNTTKNTTKSRPAKARVVITEPATPWHAARLAAATARATSGETVKERRNDVKHADGAAAVEAVACPQCKARKGALCFKANGTDRTQYVHAPRFAKWEATQ